VEEEAERIERWEVERSTDEVYQYLTKLKINSLRELVKRLTCEKAKHLPHLLLKITDHISLQFLGNAQLNIGFLS